MKNRFIIPDWVKTHYFGTEDIDSLPQSRLESIRHGLNRLKTPEPEASIVIPAYNEEKEILKTLSSLSRLQPECPTELIIVNNNSKDRTQEILDRCGATSLFVKKQGVTYARQAGLEAAKGKYIVSGDADSIYPPDWGNAYVNALKNNEDISVVYGRYSFIPSEKGTRLGLAFHEMGAEMMFNMRKKEDLCVNVVGFNSAFRKEQAMAIGGYDHELFFYTNQRGEDGWLAKNISKKFGSIAFVPTLNRVWTSDRRLLEEGSLGKASMSRVKKYLKEVFTPPTLNGSVKNH
jgi:glycosyltransferase involved in cell wall biosynthesis